MKMSCCDGFIKYLLFFFNLVFSIAGLGLIAAGSHLIHQAGKFHDVVVDIKAGFFAPQVALIVLGIIIFVTATLGCCGAIKDNRCKLITYAIILLTIFIIQLGIGIYAAVKINDIQGIVVREMKKYFDSMFKYPDRENFFHGMEEFFQCCGVNSYSDYSYQGQPIPKSCCINSSCNSSSADYWKVGCADAITNVSTDAGKMVAGLGIVLALLEVFGAAFALRLASLLERVY